MKPSAPAWMAVALLLAVLGASPTGGAQAKVKAVLMIAIDDIRSERVGFGAATPSLDALAAKSAVLRANFVQQAVCGPTRVSIGSHGGGHNVECLCSGLNVDVRNVDVWRCRIVHPC